MELGGIIFGLVLVKVCFSFFILLINNLTSNWGTLWRRHKMKTQHQFSSTLMLVVLEVVWAEVWVSELDYPKN